MGLQHLIDPVALDLPFKELVLVFLVVVYIFHTWLDIRQRRALLNPKPPKELSQWFSDEAAYRKIQAYSLDKWWFGLFKGAWGLVESFILLMPSVLPWAWQQAGHAVSALPHVISGRLGLGPGASEMRLELAQSVVFMLGMFGFSLVTSLPWSLYSTFVIEARHGFNKQTLGLFIKDQILSVLLTLVLAPPLILGMTYILMTAGPRMPLYLWLFMLCVQLIMMTIFPVFIQPLFNKFTALPEGGLRTQIEALAAKLKFPLKKIYTMDGSKRSAHSNAYMYGFGSNKRIVIYDTLTNDQSITQDQIVAVIAHELGHWKCRHTPINFCIGQVILLVQFSLFAFIRASPALFRSFGFLDCQPALVSLILFQQVIGPLDEVLNFLLHVVSRRFEFQADAFAVSQGFAESLKHALILLQKENKSALHVDPLFSALHYSHPPLIERLRGIERAAAALAKKAY